MTAARRSPSLRPEREKIRRTPQQAGWKMSSSFSNRVARAWRLAHDRQLVLGHRAQVMGVLNVTPDSFSDGGEFEGLDRALARARQMLEEGAVVIDVGGESTRPDATPVTAAEEQRRLLPVVEAISSELGCLISVDTYRAETARLALAAGAHIVNDVYGLQREPQIARVAAEFGAGLVIGHTGRDRVKLPDVIEDQVYFLERSLEVARSAGVADDCIMLDPGFGFAKDREENLQLLARFEELRGLGLPWLVGTSRKRFVTELAGQARELRDAGTAATSVLLRLKGADLFRVHNVAANVAALALVDAVLDCEPERGGASR
jgi:dihydropteroate synthase